MRTRVLVLGLILSIPSAPLFANSNSGHMLTTGLTSQPIGHYNYCKSYRADCQIISWRTKAPELTRERWDDLVEVNAYSNSTIAPYTDQEIYNVEEHWAYPESYGDCEDYVLMKRHMLMQRGWPASSLLITVVRQPNGEGHAVLTVRTDKADYILDNLDGKIRPWHETPYTYLKRQDVKHSGRWTDIRDNRVRS
ncbi:MAG: transglutaminase-like cysteine peptidase [Pseudomonadota bacterium]